MSRGDLQILEFLLGYRTLAGSGGSSSRPRSCGRAVGTETRRCCYCERRARGAQRGQVQGLERGHGIWFILFHCQVFVRSCNLFSFPVLNVGACFPLLLLLIAEGLAVLFFEGK